jgi:cytochrome c biogenesis protein CcmG, thiol:disulfide interchange protein DsbE
MGRRMKRNWLIWIPLAAFAFFGGLFLYGLVQPKDEYVRSGLVGQPLPAFELPAAVAGVPGLSTVDFADGKPRMLNIFASWCLPCKAEAPFLEQIKEQGVEIHAIAIRDKPEDVAAFLSEYGNPFVRIGADADMLVQLKLGSSGVPETYLIDGNGNIIHQHIGDIRAEHVAPLVDRLKSAK